MHSVSHSHLRSWSWSWSRHCWSWLQAWSIASRDTILHVYHYYTNWKVGFSCQNALKSTSLNSEKLLGHCPKISILDRSYSPLQISPNPPPAVWTSGFESGTDGENIRELSVAGRSRIDRQLIEKNVCVMLTPMRTCYKEEPLCFDASNSLD